MTINAAGRRPSGADGSFPEVHKPENNQQDKQDDKVKNIKIDLTSPLDTETSVSYNQADKKSTEQTQAGTKENIFERNIDLLTKITGLTKEELLDEQNVSLRNEITKCLKIIQEKHISIESAPETVKKYIIAICSGWTVEEFDKTLKNNSSENVKTLEEAINQIAKSKNKDFDIKTASKEELKSYILEYFNTKLESYQKTNNKEEAQKQLKKDFGLLLANSSDEDKALLLPVALDVINDSTALKLLFESCGDKNNTQKLANSVKYDKLETLEDGKRRIIIAHFSKEFIDKNWNTFTQKFKEFYEANRDAIEELLKKDPSEQIKDPLFLKYLEKLQFAADFADGELQNENLDENERCQRAGDINTFMKEHAGYDLFLQKIVDIYNDPNSNFSISKEKFKEIFDTITDNEFSKAVEKTQGSAIDPKTGGFKKTASADVISEKRENAHFLTQQLYNNNPQEQQIESFAIIKGNNEASTPLNAYNNILSSASNYSVSEILDIITGKKDNTTRTEEDNAIESYKLQNIAIQGNLLRSASGKFFNKLLENTKTYTLKLLIAAGWKGNSFTETQKVQETIKERDEKTKKSA